MDGLIAFLRARLDEDEQVARSVGELSWGIDQPGPDDPAWRSSYLLGKALIHSCDPASLTPEEGEHIARWDPARVLAEVEAKRRTLDAHDRPHDCIALEASGGHSVVDGRPWEAWAPHHTADRGPCFVIRCLALPYAQHPDYREEWRP